MVNNVTSRRGFVLGDAAVSLMAAGKPIRSLLGADGAVKGESGWQNPYVTDGLVAMWDGEWNAGGGVHDASAATLRNLVGIGDIHLANGCVIGDGSVSYTNNTALNAITDTSGWGGLSEDVSNLPTMGDAVSYEYVGNLPASGGWAYQTYSCAFRDGILMCNNQQVYFLFGDGTNLHGRYIYASRNLLCHSVSGSNLGWYVDGISSDLGDIGRSERVTDSKVRIMGAYNTTGIPFVFNCLRIYNRDLTAAEIAANYAIDKERFGLVL